MMNTDQRAPVEIALSLYRDREFRWERDHPGEQWPHRSFVEDLDDHMRTGVVIANTLFFVMAKAVDLNGRYTWLVQFAVGPLQSLLNAMPFPLPYIGFARNEEERIRIYKTDTIIRMTRKCEKFYIFKPSNYGGFLVALK